MDTTRSIARTSSRIALTAAALSAASWTAKGVAIGLAGGLGLSPAEGPLFLMGLASFVAALVFLALAWTKQRRRVTRIWGAVAAVPLTVALAAVTRTAVWVIEPADPGWVWAEINLWFLAAGVLAVAVFSARRAAGVRGA